MRKLKFMFVILMLIRPQIRLRSIKARQDLRLG